MGTADFANTRIHFLCDGPPRQLGTPLHFLSALVSLTSNEKLPQALLSGQVPQGLTQNSAGHAPISQQPSWTHHWARTIGDLSKTEMSLSAL